MSNSALFNALVSNGRSGAPSNQSEAPVTAEAGIPSPASAAPLSKSLNNNQVRLPEGNARDAMNIGLERVMPREMGPPLPNSPLPAESEQIGNTLNMVAGGVTAPADKFVRAAPISEAATAAKAAFDKVYAAEGWSNAAKMLFQKANRMMSGVRQ